MNRVENQVVAKVEAKADGKEKTIDKSISNNVSAAIRNKAIDDYFKITLQGYLAAGVGQKEALTVVREAMDYAIAAYYYRCELLGVTFCKAADL